MVLSPYFATCIFPCESLGSCLQHAHLGLSVSWWTDHHMERLFTVLLILLSWSLILDFFQLDCMIHLLLFHLTYLCLHALKRFCVYSIQLVLVFLRNFLIGLLRLYMFIVTTWYGWVYFFCHFYIWCLLYCLNILYFSCSIFFGIKWIFTLVCCHHY